MSFGESNMYRVATKYIASKTYHFFIFRPRKPKFCMWIPQICGKKSYGKPIFCHVDAITVLCIFAANAVVLYCDAYSYV